MCLWDWAATDELLTQSHDTHLYGYRREPSPFPMSALHYELYQPLPSMCALAVCHAARCFAQGLLPWRVVYVSLSCPRADVRVCL